MNFRADPVLIDAARRKADAERTSLTAVLTDALRRYAGMPVAESLAARIEHLERALAGAQGQPAAAWPVHNAAQPPAVAACQHPASAVDWGTGCCRDCGEDVT